MNTGRALYAIDMHRIRTSFTLMIAQYLSSSSSLLVYFAGGVLIIGGFDPGLTVGAVVAAASLSLNATISLTRLLDPLVDYPEISIPVKRVFDALDEDVASAKPATPKRHAA